MWIPGIQENPKAPGYSDFSDESSISLAIPKLLVSPYFATMSGNTSDPPAVMEIEPRSALAVSYIPQHFLVYIIAASYPGLS